MLDVVDLTATPFDVELSEPFGIATGTQAAANNVLVRLRLADGSQGIGEAAPFPAVNGETQEQALSAIERLRPLLVGADARRWRRAAQEIARAAPECASARCAIESALLDALCRSRGLSLWTFFGGVDAELVTDLTIPTGSVAHAAASAERAVAAGFDTLKVKVGAGRVDDDLERLAAIGRSAPTAGLVLDANAAYDSRRAIALCEGLGALRERVVLFEQPTPADDLAGLAETRARTGLPIAADESVRRAADVARLAAASACDVVNVKITKSGIAEALDIVAAARAHGLGLMIGGMVESEIAMTVSACLAAGQGGFGFVDLDTPLFLASSPTAGGSERSGAKLRLDRIAAGHGVELR